MSEELWLLAITLQVDATSASIPEAGTGMRMPWAPLASPGSFVGTSHQPGAGELTV